MRVHHDLGYVWEKCYNALSAMTCSAPPKERIRMAWLSFHVLEEGDFPTAKLRALHRKLHNQITQELPDPANRGKWAVNLEAMSDDDANEYLHRLFDLLYGGIEAYLVRRDIKAKGK